MHVSTGLFTIYVKSIKKELLNIIIKYQSFKTKKLSLYTFCQNQGNIWMSK